MSTSADPATGILPTDSATSRISKEALDSKHRKEVRDLQARITQKKKSATKKTRKGVNDECEQLERDLRAQQQRDRDALNGVLDSEPDHDGPNDDSVDTVEDLRKAAVELKVDGKLVAAKQLNDGVQDVEGDDKQSGKKRNRQRERLARKVAEQEAEAAAAAEEALTMTDHKANEQAIISAAISSKGLREHLVRSDGHCLYAAMADQLSQADIPLAGPSTGSRNALEDYQIVRREVANFVLQHPDDYLPFLDEEDMSRGIEGYAEKIRDTGEWGGQLEIAACARRWGLVVNVLQGDGRVEKIEGDETDGKKEECWLAYYKHSFGLGEHYNSLRRRT